jgi:hypothetical protein
MRYVRGRCALPSGFIEKNDEAIRQWIQDTALIEFSNYVPDWERTGFELSDPSHKYTGDKSNWYVFFDEEDLDIYGIRECYFPFAGNIAAGHPLIPPMSFEGSPWWALDTFKARTFMPMSMWSYVYKFIHPNIVEIPNDYSPNSIVVEYERSQPKDLRKIPAAMEMIFQDLAAGHVMLWLGGIRQMYSTTTTPFGEIPLNGEALESKGQELRTLQIERLTDDARPPIIVDVY